MAGNDLEFVGKGAEVYVNGVARPSRALVSVSHRNELSFCSVKTVDMRALVGIVAIMLTASVALAADDCFSLSPTRLDDYPAVHREKAKTYQ